MKKTFTVTEDELRSMLKEAVQDAMSEFLVEMAQHRGDYKANVGAILPQVIENWCLVKYTTLTGITNCRIHWSKELITQLWNAAKPILKGNDSPDSRETVFNEIMFNRGYNDPSKIADLVKNKFRIEKFKTDSDAFRETVEACANQIWVIFYKIIDRDRNAINEYVRKLSMQDV